MEPPQISFFKLTACAELIKASWDLELVEDSPFFPAARAHLLDQMVGQRLRQVKEEVV